MNRLLLITYSAVFLLSAALLFVAQPMIARMVLPLFGGSPSVWTTSMLFFQVMLLIGYGYAHWLAKLPTVKFQLVIHLTVAGSALLLLPMSIPESWGFATDNPVLSLLLLLVVVAGGPFFVVTTTSPLLQRWFSKTSHSSAHDPYFLYATSNVGSLVALLGYPFLVEPAWGLSAQLSHWRTGYWLLFGGLGMATWLTWKLSQRNSVEVPQVAPSPPEPVSPRERWTWILLAFIPSSWMLSTTVRLTTNIAPMPLLWIIPLTVYLLTFILVFAKRQVLPHSWMVRLFPFALILLVVSILISGRWQLFVVEVGAFFFGTMVCHGELARRRPSAERLTEFYLMMSIGGALGGFFNAVCAPLFFDAYLEFPIVVALACWIKPDSSELDDETDSRVDLALLLATTLGIGWLVQSFEIETSVALTVIAVTAIPILIVSHIWGFTKFAALVVVFVLGWDQFDAGPNYDVVERARSFFGVHTVVDDVHRIHPDTNLPFPRYRRLMHGTTQHGCQSLDERRKKEPLAYYHWIGPLGDIFDVFGTEESEPFRVGVIGLGTGAMATYATETRQFVFFEIDPVVKEIAFGGESAPYFSYMTDTRQKEHQVIVGDGRVKIAEAKEGAFSMVILDAFSSDAIPTHLLTQEAIELYFHKVDQKGVVAFHISNRYLDLSRVLAANADKLGLVAYIRRDVAASEKELDQRGMAGIGTSTYVIMARKLEHLKTLPKKRWQPLETTTDSVGWTDDFSNILSVLRWDPRSIDAQ